MGTTKGIMRKRTYLAFPICSLLAIISVHATAPEAIEKKSENPRLASEEKHNKQKEVMPVEEGENTGSTKTKKAFETAQQYMVTVEDKAIDIPGSVHSWPVRNSGAVDSSVPSLNRGQRFSFLAGGNAKHFGDLESGPEVGRQPKTGYDEVDGDVKLEFFLNPDSRLVFVHQQVAQNNAWRTHKTIFSVPWRGTSVGDEKQRTLDQRRHLTYLQYHQENLNSVFERLKLSLSYQLQDEERFRIRSNDRQDLQGFHVGTIGMFARIESPTRVGNWAYGIEYYGDSVRSFRRDFNEDGSLRKVRIQGPIADEATYDTFGAYAEDQIAASEQIDVILGARYSYASAEAGRVQDPISGTPISLADSWNNVTASARALVHIDQRDRFNLFGGVSQGFRAPNLSDLTRFDISRSSEIETPVLSVDPESFIAYEVGLKAAYPDWVAQVAYFYTDIS